MTAAQTEQTEQLRRMLHAGGRYAYLWSPYSTDPDANGTSLWFDAGGAIPQPPDEWQAVYFNVHPCHSRGTERQRSGKHAWRLAAANCLYADFDAKHFDGGIDAIFNHLDALLRRGVVYPTAIVNTGGGLHAYWLFEQTINLRRGDNKARLDRAQKLWVEQVVRADGGAKCLSRVLRLPGTLNTKYDPAPTVEIVEFNPMRVFPLRHIGEILQPYIELENAKKKVRQEQAQEAAQQAPTAWNRLVQWAYQDAVQGSRHKVALRLASRLKEAGCPETVAEELVGQFVEDKITDRRTNGEAQGVVRYVYR